MGNPLTCPYCGDKAVLDDGHAVYGSRRYGNVWICAQYPKCDAYVGCHRGTTKPLGRLANAKLRAAKQAAHAAFDPLWQRKMRITGESRHRARNAGYQWLAGMLGIPVERCHIGMFDVAQCNRVVELCKPYRK